ncbi:hypothetical protein [Luteolibacter sp. LG18]|uniref:hypothetical protein n=1 Tax=Luteolibacter sp. LG18 TaxID=2819286 RepID=UPI002B2AC21F|nr:hypothetical protein llg_17870 [Luteolibacter sp. LG18]
MNRLHPLLKTTLPPLAIACAVYGAARIGKQWQHVLASDRSTEPPRESRAPDTGETLRNARDLHGLARRRLLVALESTSSLSTLERLRASGASQGDFPAEVIEACAAEAPEATWRFLISGPASVTPGQARIVLTEWLRRSPDILPDVLRMTPAPSDRSAVVSSALDHFLCGEDPSLADAVLRHFDLLVAQDPALAGKLSPTGAERTRCLARLLSLPPSTGRDNLWAGIADGWLKSDWLAATTWSESLPPESRKKLEARFAATAFRSNDPNAGPMIAWAAQWLSKSAPSGDVARLGPVYVEALARSQPDTALEWANARLSGYPLTLAIGTIAATRFSTDPDGAREMVADLPSGGTQQAAAAKVAAAWAKSDPVSAMDWWLGFPHDTAGPVDFSRVSQEWNKEQWTAFRTYAVDEDTPLLPDRLATLVIDTRNPGATVELLEPTGGINRERLLDDAFAQWARQDPGAAASRMLADPILATADRAGALAETWYESDRGATVAWIARLPEGDTRDTVAAALRSRISADPGLSHSQQRSLASKLP